MTNKKRESIQYAEYNYNQNVQVKTGSYKEKGKTVSDSMDLSTNQNPGINIMKFSNLVGEDEITNLLPHAATQSPLVIRSHTTESKTKTNKGYEEHKLKLALQQSNLLSSNSSKSSKNDSLKRRASYNTVTGGATNGLGSGAQVISSREFDQMRRNSQSIG